MAAPFKKTAALSALTKVGEISSPDTVYWKNLDVPITKKEFGNITHIEFSPVSPYNYAVTSSTRVQIYSSRSNQIIRSLTRFSEAATSGSFRSDGKLLVAGSEDKKIRLFEPTSRSVLRILEGHTDAVLVSKFLSDNLRVMSASSDKTVRVWSIADGKQLIKYDEFKDYVKCGVVSKSSPDLFLAGAYDHSAKLFDARLDHSVMTVDHGCPIESVLLYPSDGIFLTAGGNVVKVWDALAGGKQLTQLCHHHKTITSLCFCTRHRRFMSASIDRHVNIYDVGTYQVVHTLDYPGNILSLAVAADDSVVAVGMEGGLLSIQQRKKVVNKDDKNTRKRKAPFHFKPQDEDVVVLHKKKEKMSKVDNMLRKFQHSKALDQAMQFNLRSRNPEVTVGVVLELTRRGALRAALAGREPQNLLQILYFIHKNIWKLHFHQPLGDMLDIILDLYKDQLSTNAHLTKALDTIRRAGELDIEYSMELLKTKGILETILNC